jgi:formiminotetrahydrofolate cyclodeaminase
MSGDSYDILIAVSLLRMPLGRQINQCVKNIEINLKEIKDVVMWAELPQSAVYTLHILRQL